MNALTENYKFYAGIGSRETPNDMLLTMSNIARQLSNAGWALRSGHAKGADKAFEHGAKKKEIHLPWDGYENGFCNDENFICPRPTEELCQIAADHHPKWDELTDTVKLFMVRNVSIILGADLKTPVKMVICWTPGARGYGGTGHGIRVAKTYHIPVFDLYRHADQVALCKFVEGN